MSGALHLDVLDDVDPQRVLTPFERNRAAARAIVTRLETDVTRARATVDHGDEDAVRALEDLESELAGEKRRAAAFDLVAGEQEPACP